MWLPDFLRERESKNNMSEKEQLTPISNVPQPDAVDLSTLNPIDIANKKILALSVDDIIVNDDLNMRRFPPGAKGIQELAHSIVADGQLQPVLVQRSREHKDKYDLIFGFRRVKAIAWANEQKLSGNGALMVNATAVDVSDMEALGANVAENGTREALTVIDYGLIISRMEAGGMQRKDIATKLAKPRSWVTEVAQIGGLRSAIQRKIHVGEIPVSVAIELAKMETSEEQDAALKDLEEPGNNKRAKIRAKRRAKKQGKGGGESTEKISITISEARKGMQALAGVGLKEGEECKYGKKAQAVGAVMLKWLEGRMTVNVLAKRVEDL